jgi:hypothetical protein
VRYGLQGRWCVARGVCALVVASCACGPPLIDDHELLRQIRASEAKLSDASAAARNELLREFAGKVLHRELSVSSAVVASTYRRDNITRVYFGTDYDESNHLYLADIDAAFQRRFERHEHWVSIVKTYPDRQVSYELAIDPATYRRLQRGRSVSFECELAAVIRGKSVYCWAIAVRDEIAMGHADYSVMEELVVTKIS